MADYLDNKLIIKCKDSNHKEKIKKVIFKYNDNNESVFTMAKLLPCPEGFDENPTYTEIGYHWSCAVWGTKWDVRYSDIFESGNTIGITYQTAWDANIPWVWTLCEFIKEISFSLDKQEFKDVTVTHFYFDEYEDSGELMTWKFIDNSYDFEKNIKVSDQIPEWF